MGLADRMLRRWYGGGRRPLLLRPLTWLYRAVVGVRAGLYRRGWLPRVRLPIPVLVVGNITVGGSGKTPLVVALVEYLHAQGWRPGVVSRGYGGLQSEPALLPDAPDPARFGDEPCLVRMRTGVPVATGRDRPAAGRLLVGAGCDVIIADDGLQHYRLRRGIEVCVIDGERRLGNGLMLPCGPLREPPSRLRRVDYRVCNGGEARPGEIPMRLVGEQAHALRDPSRTQPLAAFAGTRVHAVAGIGNPRRFFESLRAHGIDIVGHAFADHHAFARGDLDFGDADPVLMTEKDAVKCAAFAQSHHWSVPVRAQLPASFLRDVDERLRGVPSPL